MAVLLSYEIKNHGDLQQYSPSNIHKKARITSWPGVRETIEMMRPNGLHPSGLDDDLAGHSHINFPWVIDHHEVISRF